MSEERTQYTVHPDIAVRLETSEKYIKQLESTLDGYAMIQGRHAEMIEERDWRIAELEAKVRELEGALTFGRETIARLEQDNRRLRHLDAMPVDAMRRTHKYSARMVNAAKAAGYTLDAWELDHCAISEWLMTLDGAA